MAEQDKHCLNSENEPHNLDSRIEDERRPPPRGADEADFAAEAHGFTGYENAGQGSRHRGKQSNAESTSMNSGDIDSRMNRFVCRAGDAARGPLGETQIAAGARASMRVWRDYRTDGKNERRRSYEILGYVAEGEITLIVEGHEADLVAGDSFVVPHDTLHSFRIDKPATVIEATAPPARSELG